MKVKLKDIADALGMGGDEWNQYLNTETGEIIAVTDEDFALAEDKLDLDELDDEQRDGVTDAIAVSAGLGTTFLELPDSRDLNEYGQMREFIEDLDNPVAAADLAGAIRGKGAFRRFKDTAADYGLIDAWYAFRDEALRKVAVAWCEENEVEYDAAT